ncbi:MAG: H+/Na+-translocating ferredoxin:NAD+ oxidoreductase subunit [Fusobacteriaceae bacterium]|jgi:electron transport complex protein RnfA|uniref:Ion-translocating oxidoreductase complex subunit A n=1 Tax=Hypnocyclicus thermotrophus TaxID=1627895 RepID=A0AA46DYE6_9FUSO|nr:electron transport complex subunit RsxA [Hypnocyclicus thermotrophus]MBZ4684153.1 electron transport complex, RnfABCDGE type, subunit [Fusobacteriales bacterium]MDN5303882.1 H+/Na+-translocating ferredoxin:NAD+ oxidoreductase subunit [Fusobacteriaceae bacterium]TDT69873.1 electron transport complex protein RnfA [Hypnocyclicus thermotrophus]
MDLGRLISIIIGSILINNFIFSRFLGICPFMGVSKKIESSIGMGMAVTFVMTLASSVTWIVYYYILKPFHIEYLEIIAFILIVASLVQFVEMAIEKTSPNLYKALGVFLPLITTNCAVLGVALINIQEEYNFIETTANGFAAAVGFTLALVLLAGTRERLEYADVPESFKGIAIAFISAGILAMAFMGFSGIKI